MPKQYTVRFHQHAWVDITVEADNEDEARELAEDEYNFGNYDDGDTDFENTYNEVINE